MPASKRAPSAASAAKPLDNHEAALVQAHRLQARIEALHDKQDALLSPLATSITQDLALRAKEYSPEDVARLKTRISAFPAGFHRTELRTALNQYFPAA